MPNRSIREGILTSDKVDLLDAAAEVFYRRLISKVDDHGLFDGRASILRTALYPLRVDRVSEKHIEQWLAACASAGLILRYQVASKPYVQMLATRWQTRSDAKYPLPTDSNSEPMQTSANNCAQQLTVGHLVGDVVVVGDVVDNVVVDSPASASRTAPKTVDKSVSEKPSSTVWASYALAYSTRYGSEPPRNAKVNAHCKQLIDRVGAEDAPRLAAWYVKNENLPFYVSRGHPMDSLVKDCEGMLVRMRNGQAMTTREAVDVDRRSGDEITIRNAVDKSQGLTRLPIQAEYQRLPEALI